MSRSRTVRTSGAAALACGALLLGGCGSSSLSSTQLRRKAGRICTTAQRSSKSITAPSDPAKGEQFLHRGITALAPQVTALHKLKASSELRDGYAAALRASDRELALLRSTLSGLKAGNDPVMAVKALQHKLGPVEDAAGRAWREIGVPACATLTG